ncbi:MAG: hypothetical protein HKN21_02705, partial [Candidatus Eisenbacteria bacterium]|nr:hypothetical protein [Candidatus Eisenbacteria bacterium]
IEETREARALMGAGILHHLHQNRYQPELKAGILERIPKNLEPMNHTVVLEACRQFGFETVEKSGEATWYIEFGNKALIDSLPGVLGGSRWMGTFDREEGVRRENIDFFAAGHPLVEGILMELEDTHRGEVALLEVHQAPEEAAGFVGWYKVGAFLKPRCFDLEGKARPDWEILFDCDAPRWKPARAKDWGLVPEAMPHWDQLVRNVFEKHVDLGPLIAAGAFRLIPMPR